VKIDRESKLLWRFEARAHHDVAVDYNGDIFLLVQVPVHAPGIHATADVLDERITILTSDGIERAEISLLDVIRHSPYAFLLPTAMELDQEDVDQLDLLHANHLEVLDGSLDDISPLFRRGNILVSLKHLNVIMILDSDTHQIVWLWGPNNLALQHHPVLLYYGHILVFDNGTERSRVLEIDVPTRVVTWHYESDDLFSSWGGANQRLENGNTLITNTAMGYAYEVTPGGEVVWSFKNPEFDDEGRLNIWQMARYSREQLSFLRDTGWR
ncbi:MAG: arylsulfotransferase family protein, partial [Gemmatimonadales bacterium]